MRTSGPVWATLLLLLVTGTSALIFPSHDTMVQHTCLTSSGTVGRCVSVVRLECSLYPTVTHLIRSRPRICAFSDTDALVCCPLHAIQGDQDRRLTRPATARTTPRTARTTPRTIRTTPRTIRTTPRTTRTTRTTPRTTRTTPVRTIRTTPRPTPRNIWTTKSTRPTTQPTKASPPTSRTRQPPTSATPDSGIPRLPLGVPHRSPAPVSATGRPSISGPVRLPDCGVSSPFVLFLQRGEYLVRRPRFGRATPLQVGGQPWTALVGVTEGADGSGRWFCVGALVAPRVVVTLAHCTVIGGGADSLVVGLGEHDLRTTSDGSGGTFQVAAVRRHPEWAPPSRRHDLALLLLEEPAGRSQLVNHVCLPPPDPLPPAPPQATGSSLLQAAYHMDVHNLETTSGGRGRLRSLRTSIQPLSNCLSWLEADPLSVLLFRGGPEPHTELCLSAPARCEMDEGSPLVSRAVDGLAQLEGLQLLDGCVEGRGQLVVRLRHYVPWIVSNSEEMLEKGDRQGRRSSPTG